MSLRSSSSVVTQRLVNGCKLLLNPKTLRGLRHASSDRGRERYRRAGISASASLIQKALTIVISLVSVPLTVHYLGPETLWCLAYDQQPSCLDGDD